MVHCKSANMLEKENKDKIGHEMCKIITCNYYYCYSE